MAPQVLISSSDPKLTNAASELDEDATTKLNMLRTLCQEQGTKDEEEWLTEIAQAVFEFSGKAPIPLVEAWKKGMDGWTISRERNSVLIKSIPVRQIAPPNSPAQSPSHVRTLERSDNMPGFKEQEKPTWQEKLQLKCREVKINPPVYETFSDRRGGRTAWSSRVTVSGQCVAARYWYDGQHLYNAKEDAAEMALKILSASNHNNSSQGRSRY